MTVATHSSWGLSARTAGLRDRWASGLPWLLLDLLEAAPTPELICLVTLGHICAAPWPSALLSCRSPAIKGAGVKAETDTVVQFALLHLGSSCGFWVTICFLLPSPGPAPDTRPASHPGLHQPTASLPGSAPGLTPMVDPHIAHSTASDQTLTDTDLFSTTFNRATV